MKLKCIGGLANGQIVEVESYYREHDLVNVPAKITFEIDNFEEDLLAFRENRVPESMSNPYYFYKVAVFHFEHKEQLKFLIPVDMSIKNALCFVLGA